MGRLTKSYDPLAVGFLRASQFCLVANDGHTCIGQNAAGFVSHRAGDAAQRLRLSAGGKSD
jgi:hypothetical protein